MPFETNFIQTSIKTTDNVLYYLLFLSDAMKKKARGSALTRQTTQHRTKKPKFLSVSATSRSTDLSLCQLIPKIRKKTATRNLNLERKMWVDAVTLLDTQGAAAPTAAGPIKKRKSSMSRADGAFIYIYIYMYKTDDQVVCCREFLRERARCSRCWSCVYDIYIVGGAIAQSLFFSFFFAAPCSSLLYLFIGTAAAILVTLRRLIP